MRATDSKENRRARRGTASARETEAAGRGKRARDHLARKRRQERQRIVRQRTRAETSENRARFRNVLALALFALAFVSGLLTAPPFSQIVLFSQTRLERIAVQGTSVLTPLRVAAQARLEAGRSMNTIDPSEIRKTMTREPWIESARALRLPTGTLLVSIVERQAVARWRDPRSGGTELIDQRGERFAGEIERGGRLPLVYGEIESDESIPASAIEILDEIRRYVNLTKNIEILTLHLPRLRPVETDTRLASESGYILQLGKDGPRALLGKRLLPERVARLAALLESEESAILDAGWIDLRYADRAVLRTEPASG